MIRPDLRSGGALASKLRACSTTRGGAGRGRVPSGGVGEAAVTSHRVSHLTPPPHTAEVTSHRVSNLTPSPHTAAVTSHRRGHLTLQQSPHMAEVTSHRGDHGSQCPQASPSPAPSSCSPVVEEWKGETGEEWPLEKTRPHLPRSNATTGITPQISDFWA